MNKLFYILPVILLALLLGAAAVVLMRGDDPSIVKTETGKPAPEMDIQGPAAVNFFASWCVPCEAEHASITALAEDIPVYGINYMDTEEKAAAFLQRLGDSYEEVFYDTEGRMGVEWGLIGVPTTYIIDADNTIIYRHDSPVTPALIDNEILPLLEGLE